MTARRPLLATLLLIATAGVVTACATTPPPPPRDVLVLGGTGLLGSEVVKLLVADGVPVTVFARPGADRGRLAGLAVDYVVGDLTVAADVERAFAAKRYAAVITAATPW